MTNPLTPDGLLFLSAIAAIATVAITYTVIKAIKNHGIAVVPDFFLFGVWGFTTSPWMILIASSQKDNAALIAHERSHQMQQRRDGLLTFWFGYLFNKTKRLNYEVEAYKVWLDIQPHDYNKVMFWLEHGYNTNLTKAEISKLLTK
jgi:heme/copper-type cytochrome/quinol oxidase subunit 3